MTNIELFWLGVSIKMTCQGSSGPVFGTMGISFHLYLGPQILFLNVQKPTFKQNTHTKILLKFFCLLLYISL